MNRSDDEKNGGEKEMSEGGKIVMRKIKVNVRIEELEKLMNKYG